MPDDEIQIEELELKAQVGVSEAERAQFQRLTVTVVLRPLNQFRNLEDTLERTVDYAEVCAELQRFTSERRDRLIETLADAMAEHLLRRFALREVAVELRKFALPQTRHVAVRVTRAAPGSA